MGLSGCDTSQYPLGSMGFGQSSMTPSPYESVQLTRLGRKDTGVGVGVDCHVKICNLLLPPCWAA